MVSRFVCPRGLAAAALAVAPHAFAAAALPEPPQPGERQVQLAPVSRPSPARGAAAPSERPLAASYRTMRQAAEAGVRPFDTPAAAPEARLESARSPARGPRWLGWAAGSAALALFAALVRVALRKARRDDDVR